MDFFLFKKLVSVLAMPLNISLLLLLIAIFIHRSKPKLSRSTTIAAFLILALSSLAPVSDQLIYPYEQEYEAFNRSPSPVDYIVVLGCGHTTNDAIPPNAQLKDCSLRRLIEGLRILNLHPEAQLITSGFSVKDPSPNAEKVKETAMALGVPEHKIIVEPFPKDTQEEAQLISPRLIGKNAVLVTDAYHLPRAVRYFELAGAKVTPAPAAYYVKNLQQEINWGYYIPMSKNLTQTSIAWYETMGRIWQWIAY